jgi:NADH-quinone oxidoreductase subunit N
MWLCDVYEGSTTSVTAFFAIVPKIILFGLIIQLSFFVFKNFDTFSSKIVLFCGLSSICLASTAALYQKRIKRLLAYSTISHTGFILLGIGCVSIDSLRSCVIYVALYFIMNLATFSIILLLTSGKKMPKYLVA